MNDKVILFIGSVLCCWLLGGASVKDMPGAEDFGDGPGLGDAPLRGERRLSIKDFSQGTQAVIVEMVGYRIEIGQRHFSVVIHPIVRQHEGTE